MADVDEKATHVDHSDDGSQTGTKVAVAAPEIHTRPAGWKGYYQHPIGQVIMLGFVCFMGPGLFNALNGLGGGGQVTATVSANSNAILYGTFAFMAFFAGSINNKLGSRLTLVLGSTGYSLYIASYLALNIHPKAGAFVVVAGAILGICAGLLWTAQGSLMLAYPTESQKGIYIAIFWGIFNLGAVVGSSVSVSQNIHSKANSVGNGTYIGFLVLTLIGIFIPFFMTDPSKVIRADGTKVTRPTNPSWKTEFYRLWIALRTDPMILLLFPMFFASNYFYTWQFNDYNGALFNIRGRAVNSLCYWLSQIVGSLAIGLLLDRKAIPRRIRAFTGWVVLFVVVMALHIWAYEYQKNYTRESVTNGTTVKIDIKDKGYPARLWLYIFFGMLDAMWQTTAYWMMGAMSNDPAKLAYLTGFYKSIQSAGGAGAWRADGVGLPYMNIFISTWVLLVVGLIFALPMLHLRVTNHTELEDEITARMDDSGRIREVSELVAEEK